jgi:hypothetical protein
MRRSLLTTAFVLALAACGGESESAPERATASEPVTSTEPAPPTTETTARPKPKPKPLPGLPRYTAGYENWVKLTRKPIPPRASGDAHLGTKTIYSSKPPRGNGDFPAGTIIVKEAVRPGKDFLGLIAVMRKEQARTQPRTTGASSSSRATTAATASARPRVERFAGPAIWGPRRRTTSGSTPSAWGSSQP